jgi:hypothetical protein
MFKNFLNKYRSEVRVLINLSIFCLIFVSINAFGNRYKLQDCIIELLFSVGIYSAFLTLGLDVDNKLTSRATTLAFTISLVSALTLFVLVILMGARHTI